MKTTVEIPDALLAEAKALAARDNTTLRNLIEEGLRAVLRRKGAGPRPKMRDGTFRGEGLTPEFEAKGGWAKIREAAYPGFLEDDEDRGFDYSDIENAGDRGKSGGKK